VQTSRWNPVILSKTQLQPPGNPTWGIRHFVHEDSNSQPHSPQASGALILTLDGVGDDDDDDHINTGPDVQEWDQLTVGSSMYRTQRLTWWQVVRRRWSTHLEQPTWCHPRFVSVILDIHKTVKITFVCLIAAVRVIFNLRLTNVLTN